MAGVESRDADQTGTGPCVRCGVSGVASPGQAGHDRPATRKTPRQCGS